jgi:hypothetical protein
MFSFLVVIVGALANMFERQIVVVEKEKSPAGNWTLGKTSYTNYNTNRHKRQRGKAS